LFGDCMSEEHGKCPELPYKYTGLAIREYLLSVGAGSPYDFWKCFRHVSPRTSYGSVIRYFYILKRAGLIEPVGVVDSYKKGIPKTLYRIVPGRESDEGWFHPQQIFYPETKLGKKRYVLRRKGYEFK